MAKDLLVGDTIDSSNGDKILPDSGGSSAKKSTIMHKVICAGVSLILIIALVILCLVLDAHASYKVA